MKKDTWIALIAIAVYLIWKLSTLHFRFGDENVYFYMTKAIKDGLLPYRDFNFADPPVFIYLLTALSAFIGKHYILFKIWPPLFDSANAILIYLILKKLGNRFSVFGSVAYLFSFTVLSTSDYVTGAETAMFFMLLAIYLDMRGKNAQSGVAWALACLSKLYIAPALVAYLAYKTYKKELTSLVRIIVAGSIAGLLILLPFFLVAPHETLMNLVVYQLHRPAGLDKRSVVGLFFQMEFLLVLGGMAGMLVTKHARLVLPFLASAVFLLWFKDLYYLYLHLLIPFLTIFLAVFAEQLSTYRTEFAWGFLCFYVLFAIYPTLSYLQIYGPQGIFEQPEVIAAALPSDRPLYGVQEATPLIALLANRPLFENSIDTNTQNFGSGALNMKNISDDAIKHGIYLVARIADYPDQGIADTGYESYFTREAFAKCSRIHAFPRPTPLDTLNDVVIYRCP